MTFLLTSSGRWRICGLRLLHARAKRMPAHSAERPFACRSHFSRNTAQIDRVVLALGCISIIVRRRRCVVAHGTCVFTHEAVVVEENRRPGAKGDECEEHG
jgi:hypothetical protein